MSSIVIARLLAERGGKLSSVEHDPDWAAIVEGQLERESLGGVASLHASPLAPHRDAWDGAPWYSSGVLASLPERVDLLFVDGPPGYGEGMAHSRYPALAALASRLAPSGIIVLDDADREPEREIVERWENEYPAWSFSVDAVAGLALGIRRP